LPKQRKKALSKGYILSDGTLIPESKLAKYALQKQEQRSKQIPEDPFKGKYIETGLVEPPYSLDELAQLLEVNTYHYRCCKQKSIDATGLGWKLRPRDEKKASEKNKELLMEFFSHPNEEMTLQDVFDKVMMDYEATGNAYLEIARNGKGQPSGMWHVPARTMRVHKDKERYCQDRSGKKRWFKRFGIDKQVDMDSGEWGQNLSDEKEGNEIIHILNYTPRSDYYGLPDILPALGAIVGDISRRDYNITFFENNAVPQYAVVIQGAELTPELENLIKTYFETEIKGKAHKTLILPVPWEESEVKVVFEKLAVDIREASFRLYRQDNRDEVLATHAVPPYRIGIAEVGSLGGTTALESTRVYKTSVIKPRQERLEHIINHLLIEKGFSINDWYFKFDEIDTADEKADLEMTKMLFQMAALTPNQVIQRHNLGEPYEGGDQYYIPQGMVPVGEMVKKNLRKGWLR